MSEFFFFPACARLLLQLAALTGLVLQLCVCVMVFYRGAFGEHRFYNKLLEIAVALQFVLGECLLELVEFNAPDGVIIVGPRLCILRYLLFGCVVFFGIFSFFRQRDPWDIACIPAAAVMLPFLERISGAIFPFLFIAWLATALLRGAAKLVRLSRELRHGLSGLSVKEAVDQLPAGILFAQDTGYILLLNLSMQKLLSALSLTAVRDAREILRLLQSGALPDGIERLPIKEGITIKLADGAVWQFVQGAIAINGKHYMELYALDITSHWNLTAQLAMKKTALNAHKLHLLEMLGNIEEIRYQKELQEQKTRVHDVLGQRIAMLQRALREEHMPAVDLLISDIDRLMQELRSAETAPPEHVFADLAAIFSEIGVELYLEGSLPKRIDIACCMNAVIRESVTNAVRHGFASKVKAHCEKTAEGWNLTITNDGRKPERLIEGGGIAGMRKRVEALGGTLCISIEPRFTVAAFFREEHENDPDFDRR